jgi:hypothetical protein
MVGLSWRGRRVCAPRAHAVAIAPLAEDASYPSFASRRFRRAIRARGCADLACRRAHVRVCGGAQNKGGKVKRSAKAGGAESGVLRFYTEDSPGLRM